MEFLCYYRPNPVKEPAVDLKTSVGLTIGYVPQLASFVGVRAGVSVGGTLTLGPGKAKMSVSLGLGMSAATGAIHHSLCGGPPKIGIFGCGGSVAVSFTLFCKEINFPERRQWCCLGRPVCHWQQGVRPESPQAPPLALRHAWAGPDSGEEGRVLPRALQQCGGLQALFVLERWRLPPAELGFSHGEKEQREDWPPYMLRSGTDEMGIHLGSPQKENPRHERTGTEQ